MTTIIFKKESEDRFFIASDKQVSFDSGMNLQTIVKHFKKGKSYYGIAGDLNFVNQFMYADIPMALKKDDSTEFAVRKLLPVIKSIVKEMKAYNDDGVEFEMLVLINGEIVEIDSSLSVVKHDNFASIGSGSRFSIGALAMGATAEQALKVASDYDCYTGRLSTVDFIEWR